MRKKKLTIWSRLVNQIKSLIRPVLYGSALGSLVVLFSVLPQLHEQYLLYVLSPSVVKITPVNYHDTGGTGFQLETSNGPRIITNSHVCEVSDNGIVLLHTGKPKKIAKIIKVDEVADLCMIEAIGDMPSLKMGSPASIRQEVAVLGHPLLQPQTFSKGRVLSKELIEIPLGYADTEGKCDEFPQSYPKPSFFGTLCFKGFMGVLTSALIYPGNSGSPVVNIWGNVVGVVFAGNSRNNNGIYVPYEELKRFIQN